MTGVDIIGELLLGHTPLLELIDVESVQAGALPEQVVLPALLVRLVSTVERQMLKRGATVRTIDRVSVTVRADTYADQGEAIRLAVKACAGRTGSYAGADNVSVLTAGRGPDARGTGNSFEQAQDFRVSFDAPA